MPALQREAALAEERPSGELRRSPKTASIQLHILDLWRPAWAKRPEIPEK